MHYLNSNNLIYPLQFGFRKKHCTKSAATYFVNDILNNIDKSLNVISIFIDLSKAFDVLHHEILRSKMSRQFNFSEDVINWYSSYLDGRSQTVNIGDSHSDFRQTNMGVPQGSILGPLIFLLFINDMPQSLKHCKMILFADDGIVYIAGKDIDTLTTQLNEDLEMLTKYCKANRLIINPTKSKAMLFRGNARLPENSQNIYIGDADLEFVKEFKYLGYYIDRSLSFNLECDEITKKLLRCASIVYRWNSILSEQSTKKIIECLAFCYLNYTHTFISFANITAQNRLCGSFKKIGSAHKNYHWSSLYKHLQIANLGFLHLIVHCEHAPPLRHYLLPQSHTHNTRHANTFRHQGFHKSKSKKAFSNWAPRLWNNLDNSVKAIKNHHTFMKHIKTLTFTNSTESLNQPL